MVNVELKANFTAARLRLKEKRETLLNTHTPLAQITTQMYVGVMRNFKEEGTGKKPWKKLAASTLYQKAHRKRRRDLNPRMNIDTGLMRMSVYPEVGESEAVVSDNVEYAKYPNKTRPFMIIREDGKARIIDIARRWAFEGDKQ